jgi:hypothetical protein
MCHNIVKNMMYHSEKCDMNSKHIAYILKGKKNISIGINHHNKKYSTHAEQDAIIKYLKITGQKDKLSLFDFNTLLSEKKLSRLKEQWGLCR